MKRTIQIIIMLVMVMSLSSCRLFKKPTVDKIHDIRIASMTPDQTNLLISVKVNNPNSYKLTLNELNLTLLDRDRVAIGTARMNNKIMIPGTRSTNIDFNVILDTRKTAKMISHSDQVVFFYIVGQGRGKALGCTKRINFEESYELNIRDYISDLIPRFSANGQDLFRLQRTYISDWGITSTEVKSEFLILNPYGLSFRLRNFPAEVFINDRKVGTANLEYQLSFTEDIYSKNGTMIMRINNFKSIINALGGVVRGEIGYRITGTVVIDAFSMEISKPYEYRGAIPFDVSELIF